MAENITYKPLPELLTSAGDAATAAAELILDVPLLQNTEPKIRIDIAALVAAINLYEQAKATLSGRRESVRAITETSVDRLTLTRDILKPILGSQFGPPWQALGMPDSLAFPRPPAELQPIVQCYQTYLGNNPAQEIAAKQITAAAFDTLYHDLDAARNAVTAQELVVDLAKQDRDVKATQLRKRMRSLVDELNMLLGPLDPRWKRYGFNMPGAQETPDVPEGLSVVLVGPTAAACKWGASARAEYYRVWMKLHGSTEEPTAVGSPADLDFTLENLPANAQVDISVSAVNDGGESALSEAITVTTH